MSKYTTEVRFICETSAGLTESVGYSGIDEVLEKARDKIFDFDFPIFDESYRAVLENKILKHYYTREISAESVGLWKMWLNTRMNEIMPYYNKLYESELIKFNPMYDVDLTTDYKKTDDGSNSKSGNYSESNNDNGTISRTTNDAQKNDHWDYYSDTPQGGVNGLANNTYLTNARHITDDGTGSTSTTSGTDTSTRSKSGNTSESGTISNVEDYLHHVVGKTGGVSYSKLLGEFRETFLNIDMMIIGELKDLFMNLW